MKSSTFVFLDAFSSFANFRSPGLPHVSVPSGQPATLDEQDPGATSTSDLASSRQTSPSRSAPAPAPSGLGQHVDGPARGRSSTASDASVVDAHQGRPDESSSDRTHV
jgi:hypothetical protein